MFAFASSSFFLRLSLVFVRMDNLNFDSWVTLYKKLVYWELELSQSSDTGMDEIMLMQKSESKRIK